jgi:hypothetical protein
MWFQKLASLLLFVLAIYLACRWTGISKYIKFEDEEEPEDKVSALERNILELEEKKKMFLELEQNIIVTGETNKLDKQLALLTKKLNKLKQ